MSEHAVGAGNMDWIQRGGDMKWRVENVTTIEDGSIELRMNQTKMEYVTPEGRVLTGEGTTAEIVLDKDTLVKLCKALPLLKQEKGKKMTEFPSMTDNKKHSLPELIHVIDDSIKGQIWTQHPVGTPYIRMGIYEKDVGDYIRNISDVALMTDMLLDIYWWADDQCGAYEPPASMPDDIWEKLAATLEKAGVDVMANRRRREDD